MTRPDPDAKRIIGFKLPNDLIRRIKVEAAESGRWPAAVVEAAVLAYLDGRDEPAGREVATR